MLIEHNIILKFLFDNGTLFSQVSIIYTSTMNSRPLHDLIIHHILTSTKCSNMVANINFSSIYWSQPRLIFKAIKIEEGNCCISKSKRKRRNKYSRIKYKLFNKFNPSIQFLITILNLNSSNHITEFQIKQL
ncbi:hypothetical protein Mgra_00004612 [Meloidogyne graminicola]|uniref:Uncharacterized protein n=1 Tax=Meloidogyne graminicola TaxID=189291 RepID=A0A8S9ZRN1_9BILA|nr:hypothetical protein Mgra_00004612 [Meloidogyne graminicola]